MKRYSRLSEYTFREGKFITPINSVPNLQEFEDGKSWTYGRMPEYIWVGMILKLYGRNEGLRKLHAIIYKLHDLAPNLNTIRLSQILRLDRDVQKKFYEYIIFIGAKEAMEPLTIYLTESKAPVYAECFLGSQRSVDARCEAVVQTMRELMNHQSNEATDIRFVALYFNLLSGKLHLMKEQLDLLVAYPLAEHSDEIMRTARPMVRASEMMILTFEDVCNEYLDDFWGSISAMTECDLFAVEFPEENRNITVYMEKVHEVFIYLSDLFVFSNKLDDKMNVLLGIATYSYKILKEIYEHRLYNSIAGRSCVRVLIENYIMMKYLVKNEASHNSIWRDYQWYGIGLYKLVLARHRESNILEESHFDRDYIESLVNEFKYEEFIDIDTKYFNKQNIRLKAQEVGESILFGLYYDYDSSFEHGMWGAVRESSLVKCNNPAHKYHCVPDIDNRTRLKTIMPDCIMVMNKTLSYLDEQYGIPRELLTEVMNFEIQSVNK